MSQERRTLHQLLSPARMAPYLAAHGGRWEGAVRLYDWNTSVGGAFFESIHYLEVGLRNAVDDAASARLGTGWLSPISPVFTPRSRRRRNRIAHHEPIHGRALYVDFANVLDIATRVGTVLGEHIAATSRVPDLLAGREQAS